MQAAQPAGSDCHNLKHERVTVMISTHKYTNKPIRRIKCFEMQLEQRWWDAHLTLDSTTLRIAVSHDDFQGGQEVRLGQVRLGEQEEGDRVRDQVATSVRWRCLKESLPFIAGALSDRHLAASSACTRLRAFRSWEPHAGAIALEHQAKLEFQVLVDFTLASLCFAKTRFFFPISGCAARRTPVANL